MTARKDTASRVIAAPPAAVYGAFADPRELMAWLPPEGMKGRALQYDFREGGPYSIELAYGVETPDAPGKTSARTDVSKGRFLSLVPARRIVQTVVFESDDPAFAGEMIMTWDFAPAAGGTRVTITAEHVPSGITPEDHAAGLASSLANLAAHVAAP